MATMVGRLTLIAALVLGACASFDEEDGRRAPIALDEGLQPLQEMFNADVDSVRIVTILSPTCGSCGSGVREVRRLLAGRPDAAIEVFVVWGSILRSDDRDAVTPWIAELDDPRVRHYWDPAMTLGAHYVTLLDLEGPSSFGWDVYMVFEPGAVWDGELPPRPAVERWAHQMARTSPGHFHTGPDLAAFLDRTVTVLGE